MKYAITAIALSAALAAGAGPAAAAKPIAYKGKTKEGTKISFVLAKGWVDRIRARVPTTCVSAQEGGPRVTIDLWEPPYKWRLGAKARVVVEEPWPTRHYTFSSKKKGRKIVGKLVLSYSRTVPAVVSSWKIETCFGSASFVARPR